MDTLTTNTVWVKKAVTPAYLGTFNFPNAGTDSSITYYTGNSTFAGLSIYHVGTINFFDAPDVSALAPIVDSAIALRIRGANNYAIFNNNKTFFNNLPTGTSSYSASFDVTNKLIRIPLIDTSLIYIDSAGYVNYKRTITWNNSLNVFLNAVNGGAKFISVNQNLLDTVQLPAAFSYFTNNIQIRRGTTLQYITNVDNIKDWQNKFLIQATGKKTYYVQPQGGNDANDGLTPATALQRLNTALGKSDMLTVVGLDGVYGYNERLTGNQTGNFNLILTPNAHVGAFYAMSGWATDGTYTNVQEVTNSNVSTFTALYDRQSLLPNGLFEEFYLAASVADCSARYHSYYISGTTLYVNYPILPGNDYNTVLMLINARNVLSGGTSNDTIYCQGGNYYGTIQCRSQGNAGGNPIVYLRNIKIARSSGTFETFWDEGYDAGLCNVTIYQAGTGDGFNYHAYLTSNRVRAFEINCSVLYEQGEAASDQASTLHDTSQCVTVNATYITDGTDAAIHDIGGSQRVILGSILSAHPISNAVLQISDEGSICNIENSILEGAGTHDVIADKSSVINFSGTIFRRGQLQTSGTFGVAHL